MSKKTIRSHHDRCLAAVGATSGFMPTSRVDPLIAHRTSESRITGAVSVCGWFFDVVNNEDIYRGLCRHEAQTKLLLDGCEDGSAV
jgi:hypothetical protein